MTYVLDTNVLSQAMASRPEPVVAAWLAAQTLERLFTVSVCQSEILSGISIMPKGKRRDGLQAAAAKLFGDLFAGRVLPFDTQAATIYADLFAARRRLGRPTAMPDLMIASVARAKGAPVVTRDESGFTDCGLTVVNPWHGP